jgi:hypothetical protein
MTMTALDRMPLAGDTGRVTMGSETITASTTQLLP